MTFFWTSDKAFDNETGDSLVNTDESTETGKWFVYWADYIRSNGEVLGVYIPQPSMDELRDLRDVESEKGVKL